ncbi:ABC-transporter-regulating transcription factor [Cladobotryum mycophilum]|uniref:ABC-transporter-regulating transcription factor n=1 Tax=Cladobotryum mycophilum TaxID=491253 RepID=A0ABR0SMK8_9HYPO
MSIQHGVWTSRLADYAIQGLNARPLNPRIFSSAALCTAAARASISLLSYIPQGDFSCVCVGPCSTIWQYFAKPLDPRAKSDVKLMSLVVTFLSMLGQEAEQGGVHRMLGVCSEFCRVATSVVEKAEKEHASRRKRKNPDASGNKPVTASAGSKATTPMPSQTPPRPTATATTPQNRPQDHLSPASAARSSPYMSMNGNGASPQGSSPSMDSMGWTHDYQTGLDAEYDPYSIDMTGIQDSTHSSPLAYSNLQQPLIPQDLFSLQMSLDWNWAEMSGGAYPSVENGNFGYADSTFSDPSLSSPPPHPQ